MRNTVATFCLVALAASPAFSEDVDVSCSLDLSAEIKTDKGAMEYTSAVSVQNNSDQVFTKFSIQIVDSQGNPIGKTSVSKVLFPGDSVSGSDKWSGGKYKIEWDEDPSIKSQQLDTFEAVRIEKMTSLSGAKCILTAATQR
jgi:hypothetical protein|tara:strand:- start:139 stop:564 length:426 start_codon:yes stop_codon:yes gene_type:complete